MQLKEQIYDEVNKLRFIDKKWAKFIRERLIKELQRDVPLDLIYEIIEDIKNKRKSIDNRIEKIKKEIDLNKTKDLERQDGWLKEFVKETEDIRWYEFNYQSDHYLFKTKKWDTYPVLRSTVCAMRNAFSSKWLNKTQHEVMMEFQLTSEAWIMIKSQTPMYKSSPIKDPISIEMEMKKDEDSIKEWIDKDILASQEAKYNRLFDKADRAYKDRLLNEYLREDKKNQTFLDKLLLSVKAYNPKDFSKIVPKKVNNNDTYNAFIADMHLWKIWTDWIVTRFGKITRYLIDRPEKNIKIKNLWDIFECVVINWEMHPWQRLWMESISTTDTIMLAVKLFEEMLLKLYEAWKNVEIDSIPWNHDRFTPREEDDPEKVPAEIVFRFLQELLKKTQIKVNIHTWDEPIVFEEWNIIYVIDHWYKFNKDKLQRIIQQYSKNWFYLVIITWDKHHKEQEINDHVTWIQTRALAWKWRYDAKIVASSLAWMLWITENEDWLIDIETKTFR